MPETTEEIPPFDPDVYQKIDELSEHLIAEGLNPSFHQKAREIAKDLSPIHLPMLDQILRYVSADIIEDHDLSTATQWLSARQFSVFEVAFCLGKETLPWVRRIAWGTYDWIQGNAVELLIRFAAKGVETETIVEEIEVHFPDLMYEAQLYALRPLMIQRQEDPALQKVLDRLMAIEDFREVYHELLRN